MTVGINGISKFGTDRLRGVLATQSGWDTAPTNLAYATDGDVATATGTGVNNAVANGNCSAGYILFDMGAVYNVWISMLINLYSSVEGSIVFVWQSSLDNSNWIPADNWDVPDDFRGYLGAAATKSYQFCTSAFARYLKFSVRNGVGQASNIGLGIKEIKAIDFGV